MDEFKGQIEYQTLAELRKTRPDLLNEPCMEGLENEKFLVAKYPYGCHIVKKGLLHIPNQDGIIVPITDNTIDPKLKHDLNYRDIPLSTVIENSAEIFIENPSQVLSLRILKSGDFFGLFELFDQTETSPRPVATNVFSGARNIFMMPKISNKKGYKRLNDYYNYNFFIPKNYFEHYKVFSELANINGGIHEWKTCLVFFTRDLAEKILLDPGYSNTRLAILEKAWSESYHLRSQPIYDLEWNQFLKALDTRNLNPNLISLTCSNTFRNCNGRATRLSTSESRLNCSAD